MDAITCNGHANVRVWNIVWLLRRHLRYSSLEGSVGVLASGIIHHYSPQASYSRLCMREITSPFCYTMADQVSSVITCRAPILVKCLPPRSDASYFTFTFGDEQASSFSSRTVATVPLISSCERFCPRCGPGEEKYGGSTQSSVIEGKEERRETIIPAVVNTAAVMITVVIVDVVVEAHCYYWANWSWADT